MLLILPIRFYLLSLACNRQTCTQALCRLTKVSLHVLAEVFNLMSVAMTEFSIPFSQNTRINILVPR